MAKLVELLYQNRDKFTLHPDCKWIAQDGDQISHCLQYSSVPVIAGFYVYVSEFFIVSADEIQTNELPDDWMNPTSRKDYEKYCKEQDAKLVNDIDNALIKFKPFVSVEDATPATTLQSTDQLISERGSRYGRFEDGAEIMQQLKNIAHTSQAWQRMKPIQREGMDMILHKIGRVLNGDPFYDDNWKDIAGYAKLVADYLNGDSK